MVKFLFKTALLNLLRYKKRTLITASALAFGLAIFIVTNSLVAGIRYQSLTNLKLYETATGRIMAPGYWEEKETLPLKKSFDPRIVDEVLSQSDADWSSRISFIGDVIFYKDPFFEDGNLPSRLIAIDPVKDLDVFNLQDSISEGRWLKDGNPELVMGYWLAQDIGAELGSFVTVQTETRDGAIQVFDLQIVGMLNCPNPEITRSGLYLPLSIADDYLEMDGQVTEVNVSYGVNQAADQQFAAIVPKVEKLGLEAIAWQVLGADFVAASSADASSTAVVVLMILIIATVGITNTMLMTIYERKREVGVQKAIGMKGSQVRMLFIWESFGIGLIGGIVGMILGVLGNWPLVKYGIDYSKMLKDNSYGYRVQGQIFGIWDVPSFLIAFALGVGMAVLVAMFATQRVLKIDIPTSLRNQ